MHPASDLIPPEEEGSDPPHPTRAGGWRGRGGVGGYPKGNYSESNGRRPGRQDGAIRVAVVTRTGRERGRDRGPERVPYRRQGWQGRWVARVAGRQKVATPSGSRGGKNCLGSLIREYGTMT